MFQNQNTLIFYGAGLLPLPMSLKRKAEVIDKRCKVLVLIEYKRHTESLKMHLHQCGCKSVSWT